MGRKRSWEPRQPSRAHDGHMIRFLLALEMARRIGGLSLTVSLHSMLNTAPWATVQAGQLVPARPTCNGTAGNGNSPRGRREACRPVTERRSLPLGQVTGAPTGIPAARLLRAVAPDAVAPPGCGRPRQGVLRGRPRWAGRAFVQLGSGAGGDGASGMMGGGGRRFKLGAGQLRRPRQVRCGTHAGGLSGDAH